MKHRSGHSGEKPGSEGKKKQQPKGFHEGLSDIRKTAHEAEAARRQAVRDAEAKKLEDEVARMTYGPAYDSPD